MTYESRMVYESGEFSIGESERFQRGPSDTGDRREIELNDYNTGISVPRAEFLRGVRAFLATLTPEERSEVLGLVPR